jgi:hypothetical protein
MIKHKGFFASLPFFFALTVLLVDSNQARGFDAGTDANLSMKVKVFLLAGQSNMDGRGDGGKLTDDDRARLAAVRDRVILVYNDDAARPLDVTTPKPWTARKFGLDLVFGPELFFGLAVAEAFPDARILLVKRSMGGTSLYGSWNPDWSLEKATLMSEQEKPHLYAELVELVESALGKYATMDYDIEAMLWVQGETDSAVKKFGTLPAQSYGNNLAALIAAIRRDTGVAELPFYMLQVGGGAVVDGMRAVADADDAVYFIAQSRDPDAPDFLPMYGPPVGHYDYTGMRRIGEMFGRAFIGSEIH